MSNNTESSSVSNGGANGGLNDNNSNLNTITAHKLNGRNYLPWSQSVILFIRGKGKADFITGEARKPEITEKSYKTWEIDNSKVMSWLINSMTPEIGEDFLLYETAEEIWAAVKETYSNKDNVSELFRLEKTLRGLRQGNMVVIDYYNKLSRFWQQLDAMEKPNWTCVKDAAVFSDLIEQKRIFTFLDGLNDNLDEVRGRILGTKPLPKIREVVSEVRREESRKQVMLHKSESDSVNGEVSALVSRGNFNQNRKGRPWCDHCHKPGHTKNICWELHGKPTNWKPRSSGDRESKGHMTAASDGNKSSSGTGSGTGTGVFSQEQIEQMQQLFQTWNNSSAVAGSGFVAKKGTYSSALNVRQETPGSWIVDSGATDHMTGDIRVFNSFEPCQGNLHVKIADGSLSKVTGCGSAVISKTLMLKSVLYVPNLDCNLLSISKLNCDEKCFTKFYPTYCVFQDLTSERMIGTAELQNGLYILKVDASLNIHGQFSNRLSLVSMSSSMLNKTSAIMLWHYRLGHLNFMYLQKLFPDLFDNKNPREFHCDFCTLSKHTRALYSPVGYKASEPFSLIHSDVWGPSRVPSITGARWFVSFIDDHTRTTWIYLMKEKSEVTNIFKNFHSLIKNQFQTTIKVLRTDNGKEFINRALSDYLGIEGILHQTSCVNTPQQNGVSERKNRHMLEVARSLLFSMRVPNHFWGEAILTAVHLINRQPSRVLKYKTPTQVLLETYPNTRMVSQIPIRVFGCTVFLHNHSSNRSKLDPRATKCLFLGCSPFQKGYKCYNPLNKRMQVSLDVTFIENEPFFQTTEIQGGKLNAFQFGGDFDGDIGDFSDLSNTHKSHGQDNQFFESSSPMENVYTDSDPEIISSQIPAQKQSLPTQDAVIHSPSSSEQVPTPLEVSKQETSSIPNQKKPEDVIVYSRRPKTKRKDGGQDVKQQVQESDLRQVLPLDGDSVCDEDDSGGEDDVSADDLPIALRKPVRECRSRPLYPLSKYVSYSSLSQNFRNFALNITATTTPRDIHEALRSVEWKKAVLEELRALQKNNTWEVTELPKGKKTVGCKWVFTVKCKADGSIDRYKARLVAKGYTQAYGIDYEETFAPVAKMNTIRVLLSIAVNLDWQLHQLDVKNAFLNGELSEEVYMDSPPGWEESFRGKVCKLRRSLYGLKQSPRAWFERFTGTVKKYGYLQCQADHTLFTKHSSSGSITMLIVYVDDIVLTGNDDKEIQQLKSFLAREFEIKDLGNLKYFLGMEVARSKKGICINQRKYVLDLLKETGMTNCKPAETPMDLSTKLGSFLDSAPVDKARYQRLVGKLIYLSHTRPDIAFSVSLVSQFMNNPNEEHWGAVLRILRYLKMTPGQGIYFKKSEDRSIRVFTDADWAGSVVDRRSTTGYCTYVWGNLVTWRSKKQNVVSRSSAEAEFRAMAHGLCEGMWLQRLLSEIKAPMLKPMELFCDNQAAISIAKNPVYHDRTKHVEIDRHFIKEKLEDGVIKLSYIPTGSQVADVFTKALSRASFDVLCSKLGTSNIYRPA